MNEIEVKSQEQRADEIYIVIFPDGASIKPVSATSVLITENAGQ